jgi:hypothetical protein
MSQLEKTNRPSPGPGEQATARKPYHKPAVRYERVFETRALICGKVQQTQEQCAHNRKTS